MLQTLDSTLKDLNIQDQIDIRAAPVEKEPGTLQKTLLENGAAANELADIQYLRTLKD